MGQETHYKALYLVNTKEMFKKAMEGQPAAEFNRVRNSDAK